MTFNATQRHNVAQRALSQIGARYVHGGEDPSTGLDCSGSVIHAWKPYFSFPVHRAADMVIAPGVLTVRAGNKIDAFGRTKSNPHHANPLRWPMFFVEVGDVAFFYADPFTNRQNVSHVAVYVGAVKWNGHQFRRAIVNATGDDRGVEIIELDEYTPHRGWGFIRH